MVRGIGAEYYSLGVNPAFSLARFQEAHDLVVQAWTRPGPFAFEGKHYHFEYVNVWPRPYQQPHPPIWCPSTRQHRDDRMGEPSVAPLCLCAELQPARLGGALSQPLSPDGARSMHGYTASSEQIGWAAPIYVADTDEQAREEAAAAYRGAVQQAAAPAVRDAVPAGLSLGAIRSRTCAATSAR